jgi:hypothetical protein
MAFTYMSSCSASGSLIIITCNREQLNLLSSHAESRVCEVSDSLELTRTACIYLIGSGERDKIPHILLATGYRFRYTYRVSDFHSGSYECYLLGYSAV